MRRWTRKTVVVLVMLAVFAGGAYAQQKIGVVDSNGVLEKSTEGKKVMARLQQKDSENQTKIANLDEEMRKLQTKMNTQRLTLTNDALQQLSSDLEKKQTDRKRFAEDSMREMQELTARLFQRIQNELLPIIEQIGKDKGLEIILDLGRSGAIYFNPAIEITDDVVQRYDASKAANQ